MTLFIIKRKPKRKPQKQSINISWLYLMRRVPFSRFKVVRLIFLLLHWCLPIFWGGWYKIGISNNFKRRRKEIDDDLPGGIIVVLAIPVFSARSKEASLHQKYKRDNYRPKRAGKRSGKSEYFKLSLFQLIILKLQYLLFFLQSNIVYVILFGAIIYYHILR